jgi:hypothetical protein
MARSIWLAALVALSLAACERKPALPRGEPHDAPAETHKPQVVSPDVGPIKVARRQRVIVVYDMNADATRLLFRPRAKQLHLHGKRMAWLEGHTVYYCDLPEGKLRSVELPEGKSTPHVALFGDILVVGTPRKTQLRDLKTGATTTFKMGWGGVFRLDRKVLVQSGVGAGRKIRYAKLDTGEIVATDLIEVAGTGLAFKDGRFAGSRVKRRDTGKHARILCVHDTATGETREFDNGLTLSCMRFVGDALLAYGGPTPYDRRFYRVDPETGAAEQLFAWRNFSAAYGYASRGTTVAWGYPYLARGALERGEGPEAQVWLWDTTRPEPVKISDAVRARMPEVELAAVETPRNLPETAALFLSRELGNDSVRLGDGYLVWIEEWAPHWRVPAK